MGFKLSQIRQPIVDSTSLPEAHLADLVAKELDLAPSKITGLQILRESLDARHKDLCFIYTLVFNLDITLWEGEALLARHPNLTRFEPEPPFDFTQWKGICSKQPQHRPVIVGAGPAGLFAGLKLAAAGLKPLIIERGDGLTGRIGQVDTFWKTGRLDPESNIQYGIGGAGTFSDGKLTTRIKDPELNHILRIMTDFGAPPDILYWQYPHVGTDLLREVVAGLEQLIREYGGKLRFRSRLTGIHQDDSKIRAIEINGDTILETDILILATGNSARDVYRLLDAEGFQLEAKALAVGVRIEHPQEIIDKAQYGQWAGHRALSPAEYHLTYQHKETGRGVYTFCMCPGGMVVGATSEPNGVVTNGMSYHARDSKAANSAIVVTVNQKDFGSSAPLAGVEFQQKLEKRAFEMGGGNYKAPAQRVADFLKKQPSLDFKVLPPSYLPGTKPADLWQVLPPEICQAIASGIRHFGSRLKNFDWSEAVLTGVETRTSSPVRILRNESREALRISGVYPVGEGAGYAGGIVSSALDGWRTADVIIKKFE
jgi:uncharacterized FAD-dependent dehydrogenase